MAAAAAGGIVGALVVAVLVVGIIVIICLVKRYIRCCGGRVLLEHGLLSVECVLLGAWPVVLHVSCWEHGLLCCMCPVGSMAC